MAKKNSGAANRTWNLLRLALLWARKGGVLRRRLMMELRVVPKFIKSLGQSSCRDQMHYGEREFSFDKTPIFHFKMHRPASMRYLIPCITPHVDFDYDFDLDDDYDQNEGYGYDYGTVSYLKNGEEQEEEEDGQVSGEENVPSEEDGIDLRAEQFITEFYQQIKMQRQISYLEYNERLKQGAC